MMKERIVKELNKRVEKCKNDVFKYVDLAMRNGDYVTVYFPVTIIGWEEKYFSIETDDDKILHKNTIEDVADWIIENYC